MDALTKKFQTKWEMNMLVVAMFMRKGRLELRLVHPNFLNKNGPAAEDEYPCSEIVKMGNHK